MSERDERSVRNEMNDEPTKGRNEEMVEFPLGVEVEPGAPRVVVVTLGDQKARVTFDTEEDARRADRICTQVLLMFTTIFVTCRGRIVEGPNVWQPGEKPPECWRVGRTGAPRQDMDGRMP